MSIELKSPTAPEHIATFLELLYEASTPLHEFVYLDEARARSAQRILFDAGAGESAPPRGRLAIEDGEILAAFSAMPVDDLERIRFSAALALGRAGLLADEGVARRMQLAVGTLIESQPGDYRFSEFALAPHLRGKGTRALESILEMIDQEAHDLGARRMASQVFASHPKVKIFWERHGWSSTGEATARDPETGRELHYIHIIKPL